MVLAKIREPGGAVTHKRCPKCKTLKPAGEFHKDRSSACGLGPYCKPCMALVTLQWRERNHRRALQLRRRHERRRQTTWEARLRTLFHAAKTRAKKLGVPFELTFGSLMDRLRKQHHRCCLSKRRFSLARPKGRFANPHAPSIDQIQARGGYTEDNIRLVVAMLNYAMGQWGLDALQRLVLDVLKVRARDRLSPEERRVLAALANALLAQDVQAEKWRAA